MKVGLVSNCKHFPFENKKCVALLEKVAADIQPDLFIDEGDSLDFWQISKFDKDPNRKQQIDQDMDLFKAHVNRINNIVPNKCRKIFLEGNHEHRLLRFIWNKCPEIVNLVKSIDEYVGLTAAGWSYNKYGMLVKIGNTLFMHGDKYGVNVSLNMIRKYGMNTVHGHDHGAGIRWFQNAKDRIFASNGGHMCDVKQQKYIYGGVIDWIEAMTVIHFSDDYQKAWPTLVPIENGRCVIAGKEYKV